MVWIISTRLNSITSSNALNSYSVITVPDCSPLENLGDLYLVKSSHYTVLPLQYAHHTNA